MSTDENITKSEHPLGLVAEVISGLLRPLSYQERMMVLDLMSICPRCSSERDEDKLCNCTYWKR